MPFWILTLGRTQITTGTLIITMIWTSQPLVVSGLTDNVGYICRGFEVSVLRFLLPYLYSVEVNGFHLSKTETMTRLLNWVGRIYLQQPDQINSFWSDDQANEVMAEKPSLFLENAMNGDEKS